MDGSETMFRRLTLRSATGFSQRKKRHLANKTPLAVCTVEGRSEPDWHRGTGKLLVLGDFAGEAGFLEGVHDILVIEVTGDRE